MTWFHIHRWKTVDLHFEQPCTYMGRNLFCDRKTKRCRKCGETKEKLTAIYTADRIYVSVNNKVIMYDLQNKRSII